MAIIYWFRCDRRHSDNPALKHAIELATQKSSTLLPVTLRLDNPTTAWGFARLGPHRLAFESQALTGLAQALCSLGSDLFMPADSGIAGLVELASQVQASCLVCEKIHAPQELEEIETLKASGITVIEIEQSAMLSSDTLPFEPTRAPIVFSDFRRQVEKHKCLPNSPLPTPAQLPPLPRELGSATPYSAAHDVPELDDRSAFPYQLSHWRGDESCGQSHVARYFAGDLPRRYKETRNGLVGTDYSTKFSPWLAVGAMSARQIWQALHQHEAAHGSNDSIYWIWFELLWREHFRLMMQRFGRKLFARSGLAKQPVTRKPHNTQGFARWRTGTTGNAFIDAGMRELAATGYLSNRMRQNVASYLIHDLDGDWLAGAAWFEHCLIDFDVHSNQGNWAYIAGVGTDPRGGRRFNPDKQAHDYDRDASYRKLWSDT